MITGPLLTIPEDEIQQGNRHRCIFQETHKIATEIYAQLPREKVSN